MFCNSLIIQCKHRRGWIIEPWTILLRSSRRLEAKLVVLVKCFYSFLLRCRWWPRQGRTTSPSPQASWRPSCWPSSAVTMLGRTSQTLTWWVANVCLSNLCHFLLFIVHLQYDSEGWLQGNRLFLLTGTIISWYCASSPVTAGGWVWHEGRCVLYSFGSPLLSRWCAWWMSVAWRWMCLVWLCISSTVAMSRRLCICSSPFHSCAPTTTFTPTLLSTCARLSMRALWVMQYTVSCHLYNFI